MSKEATPRPWEVIMPNPPELWDARIFAGTRFVGMVGNSDNADGCDEANARLIVKAVNNHDTLVKCLESQTLYKIMGAIEDGAGAGVDLWPLALAWMDQRDALLAKIKGE